MENQKPKYTFRYIHLADGIVDSAMYSLSCAITSLRFCMKLDVDKARLNDFYNEVCGYIGELSNKESLNFQDWKKENYNEK